MKKKRTMRYISCGQVTKERLAILLTQLKIESDDSVGALEDYFTGGHIVSVACSLNNIKSTSNLERDIDRVNKVAEFVNAIEEYDFERVKRNTEQSTLTNLLKWSCPASGPALSDHASRDVVIDFMLQLTEGSRDPQKPRRF